MSAVTTLEKKKEKTIKEGVAEQVVDIKSGNEMAALSANHINFHVMGYYPITPSTQVPEELDRMKADGEHEIVMIPGDGEHGAAGSCYGASVGGGRVYNVTAANGLMYAMEQLPVQSGTRYSMLLNIACRSISGPLDIKCDHSDVMYALNSGWLIMMAKDPQRVYDFNIIGLKWAELEDVRLPVMVAYDGFFTSHQLRRVQYFKDKKTVQEFLGPFKPMITAVEPDKPVTIGPYMNEPDLINNKMQTHLAMVAASKRINEVFEEYGRLSGRYYSVIEKYKMEDAEVAIFILNSAYDTATQAVDNLRAQGKKVGAMSLNVIRPFPADEVREALKNVKVLVVCDRQDSYGSWGGNMTHEIKSALKDDPDNKTYVISRVWGIGGRDFYIEEAEELLGQGFQALQDKNAVPRFDYFGATPGDPEYKPMNLWTPIKKEESSPGIIKVEKDPESGKLKVKGVNLRALTKMPERIVPGHGACPGCGIFPSVGTFLKGIEGYVVMLWHTGCGMVVTTGYPYTSFRTTYIHNLFQNGAATMSGLVEMYHERQRRGEIPRDQEITFIMVTGDGGNDIGMGPTIGAAIRNHHFIILEYDNHGYQNTGAQLSFTSPPYMITSTSNVGPKQVGKQIFHKDTPQIMAATHIPYVFTACEVNPTDLIKKAAKAQWYARNEGLVFGKLLSFCPLSWRCEPRKAKQVLQLAVDSCFFPLYEVEHGITTLNYDPEAKGKKVPVIEWAKAMGRARHLAKPEYKEYIERFQAEVDRRWNRLKAMAEHPLL
ncbi:pyruvate synthase [Candidatus Sumerlaeota bacterium]|nr:pyruvate synthase [Candidatus Sumerlaeota bacterium]